MVSVVLPKEAWATVEKIPYCVGQMLITSVSYISRHAAELAASADKFRREHMTVEKLLSAGVIFQKFVKDYLQRTVEMGPENVLGHVVHDLIELPPPPRSGRPGAAVWDAELRAALCGTRMRELLLALDVDPADRRAVGFCAGRVAAEAAKVAAARDEATADCARHGLADAAAVDRVFREVYAVAGWLEDVDGRCRTADGDVDGRVAASWYARYGLQAVAADVPGFWSAYREHQSLAENKLDDQLVLDRRVDGGESSRVRVYELSAPPSGANLDADTCAKFARALDPQNLDGYRNCRYFSTNAAPGACLLWSCSLFSLNLALFSVQSPRPGGLANLYVTMIS